MCFSPEGDLVGGLVVTAIGIDALAHLRGRSEYVAVATLPVLFGLHQIDETFVWWGLQGHVPAGLGRAAMWVYLVFALVILPVLAPAVVMAAERDRRRRRCMVPFLLLGGVVAGVLAAALAHEEPSVRLGHYHLAYSIGLSHGIVVIGGYVLATCGPLFLSRYRHVVAFGVANLVAVVVLARLCADGFTSLWCFYAALVSGAIALHLRLAGVPRVRQPVAVR